MKMSTTHLFLVALIPFLASALRVPVDYNASVVPPSTKVSRYNLTMETLEQYITTNNFSSPEQCARICTNTRKICYYRFYLEHYATFTSACDSCIPTRTNKCQCVLADGMERSIISANRMIPGPSMEVCQGDDVIIDVENYVEGSDVTIHWHGIYQRGTPYYDGVPFVTQCPILSGNKFRYRWRADNPGTHFWHSHTGFQKMDGLTGSIIIRQPQILDPHGTRYDFDLSEHVIFVQDWMHELTGQRFPGRRFGKVGQRPDNFLINGKGLFNGPTVPFNNVTLERFKVTYGRRYRFRFINAFASVCPIQLVVENHTLLVIATDGEPVIPVVVTSIISTSAERYDFVINANSQPRKYWIQVRGREECADFKIHQLAVLEYSSSGPLTSSPTPTFDNALPVGKVLNPLDSNCNVPRTDAICVSQLSFANYIDPGILYYRPDVKIFLPFRFYFYNIPELFNPNKYNKFFTALGRDNLGGLVDNISYTAPPSPLLSQYSELDPSQFCNGDQPMNCGGICRCTHLIKVPLNSIVELVLVDEVQAPGINHPFHLHGSPFHVMGNGKMPNPNESISLEKAIELDRQNLLNRQYNLPPAKDTITIPSNGYVVLRFRADNPGFWLLHCHFLMHLLTGMSAVLQVGSLYDLPPVPRNFPRCGNFLT